MASIYCWSTFQFTLSDIELHWLNFCWFKFISCFIVVTLIRYWINFSMVQLWANIVSCFQRSWLAFNWTESLLFIGYSELLGMAWEWFRCLCVFFTFKRVKLKTKSFTSHNNQVYLHLSMILVEMISVENNELNIESYLINGLI